MQSHLGKVRVTLADGNTAEARFVAFNKQTGFAVAVYTDAKGAVVLPLGLVPKFWREYLKARHKEANRGAVLKGFRSAALSFSPLHADANFKPTEEGAALPLYIKGDNRKTGTNAEPSTRAASFKGSTCDEVNLPNSPHRPISCGLLWTRSNCTRSGAYRRCVARCAIEFFTVTLVLSTTTFVCSWSHLAHHIVMVAPPSH